MRKLTQLTGLMLALAVALGSSSSGDDDDDDDIVITPDANTGGNPDAAPATPDAAPGASAENLGLPCAGAGMVACPGGEDCTAIQDLGSQTEGFCTIPCIDVNDTVTCSNGYTGSGTPACALTGPSGSSCAVLCDPPTATATVYGTCAVGTVCTDAGQTDASGNPVGLCTGDE